MMKYYSCCNSTFSFDSMARKTKEEALATRNQLLDAAEHMFSTQGVARTSLHEIAETAGLTRGAIYWHFDNKGDLLTALWERAAAPLRTSFDRDCMLTSDDPLGALRMLASFKARHIEHDPRVRAVMTILMLRCEYSEETRNATEYFAQEREYAYSRVSEVLRRAVAKDQLPASVNIDQAVISLFCFIDGIVFHWLTNPERFPLSTTALNAIDAYLAGLRTKAAP